MTKSIEKGKRGERAAVAYLKSLGFHDAVRTRQYKGEQDSDIQLRIPGLENLYIEVKWLYKGRSPFEAGTISWKRACVKAATQARGRRWIILFRSPRQEQWKMTLDTLHTLAMDSDIRDALERIQEGRQLVWDLVNPITPAGEVA